MCVCVCVGMRSDVGIFIVRRHKADESDESCFRFLRAGDNHFRWVGVCVCSVQLRKFEIWLLRLIRHFDSDGRQKKKNEKQQTM